MESGTVLKDALAKVRQLLKEKGFSAKGTTFYRKTEQGNTVVLSIQKGVKSTSVEAEITINYGVYSALVGVCLQDDPKSGLDVMKAHWRKRLRECGREKWLHVKATDSADECGHAIMDAAESLLPELREHSTNEALRDEWLGGSSPGIGNMQRLLFAAILVNELGPVDVLKAIVEELRSLVVDSVHERLVERQLARAGVRLI